MTKPQNFHWGIGFKTTFMVFNAIWVIGSALFAMYLDGQFADFREELRGEFVSQNDADIMLARKADLETIKGMIQLHDRDSDIHHSRADVVTKDVYQSNRLADRQDVADLKKDMRDIQDKLDRIMEMMISNGYNN